MAARGWILDARLRETPVDRVAFEQEVDKMVDEIATERSQPARLLAMLSEVAPLLRIAGRLDEAHKTVSAAIALAELLEDEKAVFLNQLELARVMHWEDRFEISTPLFDRLIAQSRSVPAFAALLHDVLHHAGANLFAQARYPEAARYFRESQALRRKSGFTELLEASAEAMRRTTQLASERERAR